ncbi:60 kDa jasmonate-induced protein-like [Fagus crenata]
MDDIPRGKLGTTLSRLLSSSLPTSILGIVKGKPTDKPASFCSKSKRFSRDVDYVLCLHGRLLAEVFSVRINDIDGQDEDNLYSNITITDGLGSQSIFKDGKFIRQGENACLIGPARSIFAYDSFTINLDLKNRYPRWCIPDIILNFIPKQEVSHGQISRNVYDTNNEYDKLLSKEYGSVTVNYAVSSDAVEAPVEVTFENKGGESPAKICEWITASDGVSESELFRKAKKECIYVNHGETIPLSRFVVAVPLNSALIVSAKLGHHNPFLPDYEIVKDTAQFPAQLNDAMEKKISGEYGEIKVKVNWNKYRDTIPEVIPDSEKYPPRDEL